MPKKISTFKGEKVTFVEAVYPNKSVECDVYKFVGDDNRDLAIAYVQATTATPFQKVLLGDKTIEGFVSGSGYLVVNDKKYNFPNSDNDPIVVSKGDTMQWHAGDEGLTFYEICTPPYVDGRFEDITT